MCILTPTCIHGSKPAACNATAWLSITKVATRRNRDVPYVRPGCLPEQAWQCTAGPHTKNPQTKNPPVIPWKANVRFHMAPIETMTRTSATQASEVPEAPLCKRNPSSRRIHVAFARPVAHGSRWPPRHSFTDENSEDDKSVGLLPWGKGLERARSPRRTRGARLARNPGRASEARRALAVLRIRTCLRAAPSRASGSPFELVPGSPPAFGPLWIPRHSSESPPAALPLPGLPAFPARAPPFYCRFAESAIDGGQTVMVGWDLAWQRKDWILIALEIYQKSTSNCFLRFGPYFASPGPTTTVSLP